MGSRDDRRDALPRLASVSTSAATPTVTAAPPVQDGRALRLWTAGSLAGNMLLIVTGAVVRLTKSGLGCPTWPRCTPDSYTPRGELGIHGLIEFGNRTLTFVLIALVIGTFVTAWRTRDEEGQPRRRLRLLAFLSGIGIPLQGVIGGVTVRTQLNPWVVSLHLLLSVVLIGICVTMVHLAYGLRRRPVTATASRVVLGIFALSGLVVVLGTVVTGAGPHSGDGGAQRNGLEVETAAKAHAWAVWVLVAATVALLALTRDRLVAVLLLIELAQGAVGYVQYFTGLPLALVALHLVGVACFTAWTVHVLLTLRPEGGPRLVGPGAED